MIPAGAGARPSDLVPGDPGGVEALAGRLRAYAEGAAAGAARLRAIDSGAWEGEAADAFRAVIDEIPAKLERGAGAFAEAAAALGAYAATLRSAQEVAARVVGLLGEADQHSAAWSFQRDSYTAALAQGEAVAATLGPPPPLMDPGAAQRQEALRLLEGARAEVDSAARRSAARLRDAAAAAPDEPGLLSKIWHSAGEFADGAWDATWEMGKFIFKLTTVYQIIDPDGYVENLTGIGEGLAYGVTHPKEFAKAITNWDMWFDNPARALGQLVPDLVLALATGGAGAAAFKAGRGTSRVARLADDLPAGANYKLGQRDLAAIADYTGSGYREINRSLRSGSKAERAIVQDRVDDLSKALKKLPIHKGPVYRGTSLSEEQLARYLPGQRVVEPGFTSSSADPSAAFPGNTDFIIDSRTGRDVSSFSQVPDEAEVLFDAGTKFDVLDRTFNPTTGKWEIYLREVG